MRRNLAQLCLIFGVVGCSTTEIAPPPPTVAPPAYTSVPHPTGYDSQDIVALFHAQGAPEREKLKDCDADFSKLRDVTQSKSEVIGGMRELVAAAPEKYHWCFYSKLIDLSEFLKSDSFMDERQKRVLDTYEFLVPVARGFMAQFNDSRYLRLAVSHYRRVSEWVFFRRLEMTPQATSELVDAANPFGLYRVPAETSAVLEKYNIKANGTEPMAQGPTSQAPITEAKVEDDLEDKPPAEDMLKSAAAPAAATSERAPASTEPSKSEAPLETSKDEPAKNAFPAIDPSAKP